MLDCLCFLCGANSDKFIINVDLIDKLEEYMNGKFITNKNFHRRICFPCNDKVQEIVDYLELIWVTQGKFQILLKEVQEREKLSIKSLEECKQKLGRLPNVKFQKIVKTETVPLEINDQENNIPIKLKVDKILIKFSTSSHLTTTICKVTSCNKDEAQEVMEHDDESKEELLDDACEIEALESEAEHFEVYNLEEESQEYDDINNEHSALLEHKPTETTVKLEENIDQNQKKTTNRPTRYVKNHKVTIVQMKNPATYVCISCKEKFVSFELLKIHMVESLNCKKLYLTCETCGKICDSKKSLYQHSITHREKNNHVCDECGKAYSNRFNLENHKTSIHGEQVDEHGNVYKCKICDNQFNNRRDLYVHISEHTENPTVHLCDICGKCFNSSVMLRTHNRAHLNIRNFLCDHCDKRFRTRLQLTQHMHVHTGIKAFVCTVCQKNFAKKSSLITHVRLHTGERPYKCQECPEEFASMNKLKTHLKAHESPQNMVFLKTVQVQEEPVFME